MEAQYFELICDDPPYSVVLTAMGVRRVDVLQALRRLTGLSLWRSKELTLHLPVVIFGDVAREAADAAVAVLQAAGADAEGREGPPRRPGAQREPTA
ncbi:ribosomal protein L7/L12 [Streptomyces sp. ASQP_92]|uniref:ribosomal protein L7/L12 n=1 Tax=Streptomyces sp. ASQP_92 TaxID=2979116 RepID=UPI0021BE115F|nr:ribosomal protein L7/L12 [Streptomyces sp. ASQP_92]MCT9090614.1 ribosomal protein L7/L12 [Streptomyces sp. ASQP_92]